ncbi:MAG TPA: hypothetical protein PKC43_08165 [Phycisphaerales bacterium]|nr:hypothetical protein [Phycisphaerales bacterium]HMP37411.1 hypothetical protein [Phycisphaerales bacterium]
MSSVPASSVPAPADGECDEACDLCVFLATLALAVPRGFPPCLTFELSGLDEIPLRELLVVRALPADAAPRGPPAL